MRLLRENIAGCHLEVLGYPGIMDLAVKAGLADATRSLEHRSMALLFAKGAVIDPALVEYLCGFNLVVSYLFDPDGILRANLERIGVKTLLECPHRIVPGNGHAALQLARPLERLAMFPEEPVWRQPFFPRSQTEDPARAPKIAIHLGSGSEKKNWPLTAWLTLTRELQRTLPKSTITFITGEAEEARGVLARNPASGPGRDHWHALPLVDLAARLAGCDFFMGHDSGISHLAAACGVPCLLLFGPTDPDTWAPPQAGVEILEAPGGDLAELPVQPVLEAALSNLTAARGPMA